MTITFRLSDTRNRLYQQKKTEKKKRRTKCCALPGYDQQNNQNHRSKNQISPAYLVRNGLASLASSTMKKSQTTLPLPFQNNNNTNSTSSIILPAFSKPTNNNPPSCPHMPPAELSKVTISSPPLINTVADPVTDEDFMKIFFTKNNKKAFMPATTKRALLFDLLDHMEVSKFVAKGDDL